MTNNKVAVKIADKFLCKNSWHFLNKGYDPINHFFVNIFVILPNIWVRVEAINKDDNLKTIENKRSMIYSDTSGVFTGIDLKQKQE